MRIVTGAGRHREVVELPHASIREREPKDHEMLIANLTERVMGPSYALKRKGFKVYN
jgi:hypothetical protein